MYMLHLYNTYSHILTILFVRDITQPQVLILCSWSSNILACLDRLQILRGSILLLSTCTVAAIPCCSFLPRNWLSGLQITMLLSWMCLQDLTRRDPGVRPHSNRILQTCIVPDSRGINIHTFQSVEFESDLYRGVMSTRCYPFNMEHHRFWGRNVKAST